MSGDGTIRGSGRDRLRRGSGVRAGWTPWQPNLVTWAAADLIGALLARRPEVQGLLYLAVGAGEDTWDGVPPPPDPSRTALTNEVARVALVPGRDLTFNRDTGTVRVATSLPPGVGTGPLREAGLFGGRATSRPDSGTLVNHRVHDRIDKGQGDRLDREIRLVLDDGLLPGVRSLVGALLARWATATGLTYAAFGVDGGADARPEALRAERARLSLPPGAMRYVAADHALEIEIALGPGEGPPEIAEVGVFGGPATSAPGTGWLAARDTVASVDRTVAHRFVHRLRLTLVSQTGLPVPDVTGRPLAGARVELIEANLQTGAVMLQETDAVPADQVIEQLPAAGAAVAEATPIALTVAVPRRVEVPELVGLDLAGAIDALTRAELSAADPPLVRADPGHAPGVVVAAEPVPLSRVPIGTVVTLTLAVAPLTTVPDVRGRPFDMARRTLEARGLATAEPSAEAPSDATPGTVVAQAPAKGAQVDRGSFVTLTLAVPLTVPAPDVVGLDPDAARAALAAAGATLLPPGATAPAGLDLGARRDREVGRGEASGVVLAQDPPPGEPLRRYETVDVVVAVAASVNIPDLAGIDLSTATTRLAEVGLRLGRVHAQRSDQAPGAVVDQDPPAGTAGRIGDRMTVWVAAGALTTVPDVTGIGLDAAREALVASGLGLGGVSQQPAGARPGEVLGQDPLPGRLVPVGSAVAVTVSAGIPVLVGLSVDAARAAAAAVGLGLTVTSRQSEGPAGVVLDQDPVAGSPTAGVVDVNVVVSALVTAVVPDVAGQLLDAASVALGRVGFSLVVRSRPVDAANAGRIVGQDPAANTAAPVGSTVGVDVAQQPVAAVEVPDVRTLSRDGAVAALSGAGLAVGTVGEQPSIAAAGTVVAQDPGPGLVVPSGTAVALVLATDRGLVQVPDLRGQTSAAATDLVRASGLDLVVDRLEPSTQPPDTVLDQDSPAGARVPVGSTLSVVVAQGLELPNVVGMTRDEAVKVLGGLGLQVVESTVMSRIRRAGTVASQQPVGGTVVALGSQVDIAIAFLLGHDLHPEEPDLFVLEPPVERPSGLLGRLNTGGISVVRPLLGPN